MGRSNGPHVGRADKMFPSVVNDGMPKGSSQSDLSDYIAILDEQIELLKKERLNKVQQYRKIESQIRKMYSEDERKVLRLRYIKGLKWDDVATEIRNLEDENIWKKANPIRMSYKNGADKIRTAWRVAKEIPEKMTAFLTKMLNIWVQAKENGYMDMAKWKACQVDKIPIDTHGMSVYVGFDMSAKIDLTSVTFVIPFLSGEFDQTGKEIVKYILYSHSFIPNREKLAERKAKDKVDYDAWERMGFITVTDTPIVDQNAVMQYVLDTCAENDWNIECLCFDPANASKLMMDLSNEGYIVEEVFQSHKHLNEATQGFREQVYCGNILYEYNPVLNFAMSNAVIKTNQGLIKIDKDATTKRIDPVDSTLCGFKLAMYHEFGSSYQEGIDRFLESDW